jgi:hypothetical protein
MVGELNGLRSSVMQKYSDALFIHYCARRHNLVISQAICNSKECKTFLRQ